MISNTKEVYGKFRGTFTTLDITDFIWTVKNRPKGLVQYTMPVLNDNAKWDGKDVQMDDSQIDEDFLKDLLGEKNDL